MARPVAVRISGSISARVLATIDAVDLNVVMPAQDAWTREQASIVGETVDSGLA
ncbi:MAG: hypothetical protein ACREUE_09025 [Panacagrimonas sp.]